MAEEMTLENVPWESDESWNGESDEAIAEAEDSAEDIGEGWRRRRRSRYAPGRGVRGMVLRSQDGSPRRVAFPAKLATAEETNRGLARQEIGRRELEERLNRLEARFRLQLKKDSSASGLVTLAIGGSLTIFGAVEARRQAPAGNRLGTWALLDSTKIAAATSAAQIATTGAKLAINGRYHRSGLGIAADAFATVQLAAFMFGFLNPPQPPPPPTPPPISVGTLSDLVKLQTANKLLLNRRYVTLDVGGVYETTKNDQDQVIFFAVPQ